MRTRSALILSAVVATSCPAVVWGGRTTRTMFSLPALASLRVSVNAIDTEPINGFVPQLVMGLTNEQDSDEEYSGVEGFGIASASPTGMLPLGSTPQYAIATLDSGSSADIISYDTAQSLNLTGANLIDGNNNTIPISGASGDEDVIITSALGVYGADFSQATVNGGAISVNNGSMKGQYNVPVLVANQGDGLPNIIGSPILAQYRATIQNSVPQHLTVNGLVSQTPKVTLGAFSSTIPTGYAKLSLNAYDSSGGGAETEPAPYYINYELNGPTDPDIPGVWASFFTNGGVGITHAGTAATGQTFLLDTGAQLSVISNDEAASIGIFNASPANADFVEQVQGVGGVTEVPGYYLSSLTITTTSGILSWSRVPVLVLDVADPRNPSAALPGILGTNLFSDRDLVLNANVGATAQTYLAIGPQMQWQKTGGGNWSNASNWAVVLPNGVDMQANFYSTITAPSTINVDSVNTVGRITFDNTNRYTLSGPGSIILSDSADQSQINVRTGSHTIAVPISLASDTIVTVIPTTSTLTVSSPISSTGVFGLTESGFGTLLLSASNTYTGGTNVSTGTLTITGSINSTNVSTDPGAILNASGSVNAGLSKSTILNSGGAVNIGPNTGTSGPAAVTLSSIEIGSDPTSLLTVNASALRANRTVLVTSALTFDSSSAGQLDLKNNDMIIHGTTLAAVFPEIQSGFNSAGTGGYWNGSGIVSSTAAADASMLTTLGVIKNDNGSGVAIYSTVVGNPLGSFDGQNTSSSDILIKYTYYGDANLDGKVDGSDYSRIDFGSLGHLTGWYNGDFNYDGVINGSDYTLIDNVYNRQGARLTTELATLTSQVAASAVPEPTVMGLALLSAPGLLARRRRVRNG